jgi:DNA-binding NarL/FixJ family response regulator
VLQGASAVQPYHAHPARGRGVPQAERARYGRQKQHRGPTRAVLVESHPIFRDGLIQCLHAAPDFRVVGHLDSGHVDVAALRALSPGENTPPWELIETLRQIVRGEPMLTHGSAAGLLQELQRRQAAIPPVRLPPLTRREQDVLRLLATGKTNRQIAHQLELSGETIKSHLASIFRKLGVSDRTSAAIRAVKAQLVDP